MSNLSPPDDDAQPPDSYRTLAEEATSELKIQRSRFLGHVGPATDESAARGFVKRQEAHYHDARHVCFAWRLGHGGRIVEIRNDAGEPAGTAGEPILQALRKAELSDVVAVVVRYFGGVKLGTGGLARAYGQTTEAALAQALPREVLLGRRFSLIFPYALQKTIGKLITAHKGHVEQEDYSEIVAWEVWLPHSTWHQCSVAVTEASRGSVALAPLPD